MHNPFQWRRLKPFVSWKIIRILALSSTLLPFAVQSADYHPANPASDGDGNFVIGPKYRLAPT